MTRRDMLDTGAMIDRLKCIGISHADALALRRVSMTLRRWFELECGTDSGAIERDDATGKCYWRHAMTGKRWATPDRETGARKRLAGIMARYPDLSAYVQGDCRGASLYILRPGDVPDGKDVDAHYPNGVAVYR